MDFQSLMNAADSARAYAYAPYSQFAVGAALLARNGMIFSGSNIENASFSLTCCAERTAFFSALSKGVSDFSAIAISGAKISMPSDSPCYPCGACRQVMAEFCRPDFIVILKNKDSLMQFSLAALLPESFKL